MAEDVVVAETVPCFEFLGVDGDWPHCDLCGRDDLAKTYALRDLESGEVLHYGSECVKKATTWTVPRWTRHWKAEQYAVALDAAVLEYRDCPERHFMLKLGEELHRWGGNDYHYRNAQRNAGYARAEIAARHKVKSQDILPRLKQMRAPVQS